MLAGCADEPMGLVARGLGSLEEKIGAGLGWTGLDWTGPGPGPGVQDWAAAPGQAPSQLTMNGKGFQSVALSRASGPSRLLVTTTEARLAGLCPAVCSRRVPVG